MIFIYITIIMAISLGMFYLGDYICTNSFIDYLTQTGTVYSFFGGHLNITIDTFNTLKSFMQILLYALAVLIPIIAVNIYIEVRSKLDTKTNKDKGTDSKLASADCVDCGDCIEVISLPTDCDNCGDISDCGDCGDISDCGDCGDIPDCGDCVSGIDCSI